MFTRRELLGSAYSGLGLLALADMLQAEDPAQAASPYLPKKPHLPRKAKRCIFLFMQGGVSQMDSYEYKPELNKLHGKPLPGSHDLRGEIQGRLSHHHSCVASPV